MSLTQHDHNWINDRIAVGGGVWCREHVLSLQGEGVTHVIDCRAESSAEMWYRGTNVELFCARANDDGGRQPDEWFGRGVSYALDVLRDPRNKLLIHCAAGVNRGPSMAYAILRALGASPREAWPAIKEARPCALMRYAGDADRWIEARNAAVGCEPVREVRLK